MENLAPVVVFVYNRPEHARRTLDALCENTLASESDMFIYSDGPKNEKDAERVEEVRRIISNVQGFRSLKVIAQEKNRGLANSVIAGVTEIVNQYGKVIVVEDDLITSPFFLEYMNAALVRYEDAKDVYSITGYSFFEKGTRRLPPSYFLNITSSWTWATWKDRWSQFDANPLDWMELKENQEESFLFDYDGCYAYTEMMLNQMERKTVDSWAIRWYYTVFKNHGLTLYANYPMCRNVGFDGLGTNCGSVEERKKFKALDMRRIDEFPSEVTEMKKARKLVKSKLKPNPFVVKIKAYTRKLRRMVGTR